MDKKWLWKGVFLGAVFFIAMLIQRPVGVSTQFSIAVGAIEKSLNPEIIYKTDENKSGYGSTNAYYNSGGGALAKDISSPINYETMFIVGVLLGSFLGSIVSPEEKRKNLENSETEGNSPGVYLRLFFGGVILLFGARMAGGCTSGHMMSGMSQMTLSSFLFTATLFPIAIFIAKKWGA
ncbi:MAG: YeeE/YedE thiosulfate transporter family protein [Fusobacteriaceae bacterium]